MTSETKKFIELSDIISIRLECRSCGCSLLIDIDREGGPVETLVSDHNFVLAKCPTCGHSWTEAQTGRTGWDSEIKDFLRKMRLLKQVESKFGCTLALEIKHEDQP